MPSSQDVAILAGVCGVSVVLTLYLERLYQKKIRRAPGFKPFRMSKYVIHNGRMESQGITADPNKDITGQTEEVLAKMDAILNEVNIPRSNLLSMWIFLNDMSDYNTMNKTYDKWVQAVDKPTRLCVQATLDPGCLIEIRASAACPYY
uniref:Uncharacterized protein n=1 Tax=Aureoumbra lagunensis TaxID=44058 RepID=A0A7S3K559_9STRA|mmetsp:Transcript_17950/g.23385  ORF Transcript_17950/g.23385 Transcript_17950/m.23385 type:complete len:148 (+) Transcript_17950:27-470(+)|eukprot:CAMPEP_0197287870 /NCGR_PEP_ID=MMETSP0890-20130614/4669_1 /TAXON_ID=44058 ORGANISM="Aureoumbra lagunensis, Strain CCMP1510" /NCGR_SAMPLE_ID=MMETSP0890 /ASSEMBLY_ACC=CAM_ASM_000533 /LENGTH=147 /DNA_ID=CAMNT_0042758075 /DNA_START=27 /DNA_END=470 /DNA_ORIENTATION=-